jgi:hypothetical protein
MWDTRTRIGDDHTSIGDLITEIANTQASINLNALEDNLPAIADSTEIDRSELYCDLVNTITYAICDVLIKYEPQANLTEQTCCYSMSKDLSADDICAPCECTDCTECNKYTHTELVAIANHHNK